MGLFSWLFRKPAAAAAPARPSPGPSESSRDAQRQEPSRAASAAGESGKNSQPPAPPSVQSLLDILRSAPQSDYSRRLAAAESLGQIGTAEVIAGLESILTDLSLKTDARQYAATVLGKVEDPRGGDVLIRVLREGKLAFMELRVIAEALCQRFEKRNDQQALAAILEPLRIAPAVLEAKALMQVAGNPTDDEKPYLIFVAMVASVDRTQRAGGEHHARNVLGYAVHCALAEMKSMRPHLLRVVAEMTATTKSCLSASRRALESFARGLALQAHAMGELKTYQPAAAIAAFSEAIRLDPQLAEAYSQRGLAWQYLHEFEKSAADIAIGVDLKKRILSGQIPAPADEVDPQEHADRVVRRAAAQRLYEQGVACMEPGGLVADAERYLREAIEADPTFAEPYDALSDVYNTMGRVDESVALIQKWAELKNKGG